MAGGSAAVGDVISDDREDFVRADLENWTNYSAIRH